MKKVYSILILAWILFSLACNTKRQNSTTSHSPTNDSSTIKSSYFDQKLPSLTPEIFAPGIISINGRFEGAISFSPDLKEMYFGANNEDEETHIYFSRLEENEWTPIVRVNFTPEEKDEEIHPFVSPDGERVYFTPLIPSSPDPKIWYVNRLGNSWSNAMKLDSPINDDKVFYLNQGKNGGLYYFNLSKFKTYYASDQNGEFPEVQEVDIEFGHHGFISPSQDYLVVTGRNKEDENRKDNDIYVYFKGQDGIWTQPINLGDAVNSSFNEKSPSITPDGKYLFFGRDERDEEPGLSNIHWVSAEVIHKLRPNNL
jgi:Tol biopolymer transport system component